MEESSNIRHFDSINGAFVAASEAAMTSFGRPIFGLLYTQAGRNFISASLPVEALLTVAQRDSTRKGDSNPSVHRNRPLDKGHVKEIVRYLETEPKYLIPPIMLNSAERLQVFAYDSAESRNGISKPCVAVLPLNHQLYVTDGQHRLEALREAIDRDPNMKEDSIGVTIVEEPDVDKVHQDFYDAAQAMPLAKAILVEYDGRAPLNWLTREVAHSTPVFNGRIERIGTVGKNSLMLFTTNQIKQAVLQFVVGDWSLFAKAMEQRAEQSITAAQDLWRARIVQFLDEFSDSNPQWKEVKDRPLSSGLPVDIPGMRESQLHFLGVGLLILSGVGHSIIANEDLQNGSLSPRSLHLIRELSNLDWSRTSGLWRGNVANEQGKISTQKDIVALAVGKCKEAIGLGLSPKEQAAVDKASQWPISLPLESATIQ